MKIPDKVIDDISLQLSIVDIVSEYTKLNRAGNYYKGLCPFHSEKTPSFTVTPDKNIYCCFGCGAKGSLFNFVMEMEKFTFPEAVEHLAKKAGIHYVMEKGESLDLRHKKESLIELYNKVAGSLNYILLNSNQAKIAIDYLSNRQITKASIEEFHLGYAPADPNWMYNFLLSKNYSEKFLDESGLFSKRRKRYPLFRDRLMFPLHNRTGQIVGFSGRILRGEGPKYINSPETIIYKKGNTLFGLGAALPHLKKNKIFHICEGNLDVVALNQSGIKTAVAPLGTAFTENQGKFLKRFSEKGIIIFDGDSAGIKATLKSSIIANQLGISLEAVKIGVNKDPADILNEEGEEKLKKIVLSSVNLFDYLLESTTIAEDISTVEGKSRIIETLFPYLKSVQSEIERQDCLVKCADTLDLDKKILFLDYERLLKGENLRPVRSDKDQKPSNFKIPLLTPDLRLMVVLFSIPELQEKYLAQIKRSDLHSDMGKFLYDLLIRVGTNRTIETYLSNIENEEIKSWLLDQLANKDQENLDFKRYVEEQLRLIRLTFLEQKAKKILKALNGSDTIDDDLKRELLEEKISVDKEIIKLKVIST